jgi:hypothetical protein
VAVHRGSCQSQAPSTRASESPATGLPATENTGQAARASTRSTQSVRNLPSTELASPFLSCRSRTGKLTGDGRNFQRGDSLHGDSKQIHVNFHKEFVSWIVFSGKCNLNN